MTPDEILQALEDSYHSNRTEIAHVKYELDYEYWDDDDIRINLTFCDGILKGKKFKIEMDK